MNTTGPEEFTKTAICFLTKPLALEALLERFRGDAALGPLPFELKGEQLVLAGEGYAVCVTRITRLRELVRQANAIGKRVDETRLASVALLVEHRMDASYRDTVWAAGAISLPWQVLSVCELLAKLEDGMVYDFLVGAFYPER